MWDWARGSLSLRLNEPYVSSPGRRATLAEVAEAKPRTEAIVLTNVDQ